MPASFTVRDSVADGVARVEFVGDIDLSSLPAIREVISPYLSGTACRTIVVDLAAATFIDSSGLGELVADKKRAHDAGKTFNVTGAQGRVARIIDLTGLAGYLLGTEATK